jgi:hypothetical protein
VLIALVNDIDGGSDYGDDQQRHAALKDELLMNVLLRLCVDSHWQRHEQGADEDGGGFHNGLLDSSA